MSMNLDRLESAMLSLGIQTEREDTGGGLEILSVVGWWNGQRAALIMGEPNEMMTADYSAEIRPVTFDDPTGGEPVLYLDAIGDDAITLLAFLARHMTGRRLERDRV